MQITKRKVKELIDALNYSIDYKVKNLFTLRAEKLGKKLSEIAEGINNAIAEKNAEFAQTDEKGRFLLEEITITDKSGTSKKEKTGNYLYTPETDKKRKAAIEQLWLESVDIPVNLISRDEKNEPLYKYIFETYNASIISLFAGILLDVPVDADGFLDEEFALKYISK